MITAFLNVLELVSFDEALFRKEFIKTLGWVPKEDYLTIEEWMRDTHFSKKYPDLLKLLLTSQS
jgi:type IV secretory pathway TrbF-like protein